MSEIVRVGGPPIRLFATLLVDSVPTNATTLRLVITTPSAVETEYLYGSDPEIVRPSVGQYHFDLQVNAPGVWTYAWFAEGSSVAFKGGEIDVARPTTITSVNEAGAPVPFVSFKVWDIEGVELDLQATRTDSDGQHFTSLPPGSYRVYAFKSGWLFETAKIVDLVGDGPFAVQVTGKVLASRWLQWEDLLIVEASVIDRLFNDKNTGVRDINLVETVIEQAEAEIESRLLRNWTRQQVYELARGDKALRGHAAWVALEFASERKSEFISADGKGRYWAQYERAIEFVSNLAISMNRSRGEETAGIGANVGGEVQPYVAPVQDRFIFANGRNGRGPGGF